MAISFVPTRNEVNPPNTTSTSVNYTLTAPPGLSSPAVVIAVAVLGGASAPPITGFPTGWTHIGGTPRGVVFAFPWTTGSATSWTVSAAGVGAGYIAWDVFAYNDCVLDTVASVAASAQSPPVTTSTPFDWLTTIYITCQRDNGAQTCQASTAIVQRFSDQFASTDATAGGTYGIALADTGSNIGQGTTSGSSYTWSPITSTGIDWGTVTVALSGALTPSLPTNLTPTAGAFVDFGASQFFSANYNNIDGSVGGAWQFRQKVSGASSYNYWNAGSGAFQTTAVFNAGLPQFTLPGGILSNSNTYNWSFNTESSYNPTLTSGFAADSTVIGQPAPTVTVTAPTGTVTVAAPTIRWTAAPGGSAALTAYRVTTAPSPAGTPIVDDSGVVPQTGTLGSYTTGFLPNNTQYVTKVQVTQTGNQVSTPAATIYTVAYAIPAAPTISSAVAGLDANGAPVVVVTVVAPAQGSTGISPFFGTLTVEVYYTDANTPIPVQLRNTGTLTVSGGTVIIGDYEATFDVPRTYQAFVVSSDDGPSLGSNTFVATQTSRKCVLSDPLDPTRFLTLNRLGTTSSVSTSLSVQTSIEVDRSRAQTIFYPFGSSTAVVQYGDVYAPTFTLNFFLQGYAEAAMCDRLWSSARTLQFRSDMGDNWYVDVGGARPFAIVSAGDRVSSPIYEVSLACTVTSKP